MEIHHFGIIVKDMHKALLIYEKLGFVPLGEVIVDKIQNNKILFLSHVNNSTYKLELIEPLDETSTVHNFNCGYHHICFDTKGDKNFIEKFKLLKIGRVFTKLIKAPAIYNRNVVFACLYDGTFIEFIL